MPNGSWTTATSSIVAHAAAASTSSAPTPNRPTLPVVIRSCRPCEQLGIGLAGTVQLPDVDAVGLQSLQTRLDGGAQVGGGEVLRRVAAASRAAASRAATSRPTGARAALTRRHPAGQRLGGAPGRLLQAAAWTEDVSTLAGDDHLITACAQGPPEHPFAVAAAVDVSGVEERDPAVECSPRRTRRRRAKLRPPEALPSDTQPRPSCGVTSSGAMSDVRPHTTHRSSRAHGSFASSSGMSTSASRGAFSG